MIKIKLQTSANAVRLAVKLAEELTPKNIMPVIKNSEIILDDSSLEVSLSIEEALQIIRTSLDEVKINYKRLYVRDDTLYVEDEDLGGEKIGDLSLFFCPFCGYSTEYEEIYWIHVKSHGMI